MSVKYSAFKAYDVRGVYPTEINEELAAKTAAAFLTLLKAPKVVIGRDARKSSPALHDAVIKKLSSMGVDVYDIGICTTPLLTYAAVSKGFSAGIMISASHNPGEYNALKLIKDGIQISIPGQLDHVRKIVEEELPLYKAKAQLGEVYSLHVLDDYLNELIETFSSIKKLKIVVDYGNGMGSVTAKPLFEKIGMKVISLYDDVDCSFPNHPANPAEEHNLEELRRRVIAEKADCGIAFDGDADRSFFIDNIGRIIYPDIYCAIIAKSQLKGMVEKRVYYDLRFSRHAPEEIRAQGGEPIMMRVGNPFYKEKLKNEGGVFAAELSGHIMFADHYNIDDGLYAALKCMSVMVHEKKHLSQLANQFNKYVTSPEMNFKVKNPDEVLVNLKGAFSDGKFIGLDGVYIEYSDSWFNARKSNTEPLIRLRIEAKTQKRLDELKKKLLNIINS